MNDMPTDSPGRLDGMDRRQLLKVGAWAAPVVALAAAAPAASASVTVSVLLFNYVSVMYQWGYGSPNTFLGLTGSTSLRTDVQSGPGITLTSITVIVAVPSQGMLAQPPTATTDASSGGYGEWTAGTGTVSNGIAQYRFTWAGSLPPYQGTTILKFTLPGDGSPRAGILPKTMISAGIASGVGPAGDVEAVGGFTAVGETVPGTP